MDLGIKRDLDALDCVLRSESQTPTSTYSRYKPKPDSFGFFTLLTLDDDYSGDVQERFADYFASSWPNCDTVRAIYERQSGRGKTAVKDYLTAFPAKAPDGSKAFALILECFVRIGSLSTVQTLLTSNVGIVNMGWAVAGMKWLKTKVKCDHASLHEAAIKLLMNVSQQLGETARIAEQSDLAAKSLNYKSDAEVLGKGARAIQACCLKILSSRYHSAYVTGLSLEINQDRDRAIEVLERIGVPTEHIKPLMELDEMFRGATSPFKQANFIAACRAAFEELVKRLARRAQAISQVEMRRPADASADDALYCLEKHGIVTTRERELFTSLYSAASDAGSHSTLSSTERGRIFKNMLIEAILLIAQRMKEYLDSHSSV